MEKKNYTVAVDLGSSNVVVAVGEKNAEERLDVVCVVSKPVEGVNAGKIENIELVSRAIREAVSEAEEQLGIRITEAYAGISGDFVRCARHMDHVFVYDPQNGVNQKDVDALFDRMRNVQAPDDETIMDRVPQNYVVDDNQEVKNPVGSFGKKLSSTFNFILCLKTPMQRLDMALKRVGIKMLSVTSNAIATAEAVLLPDEKEEGVAVVDIGGGSTEMVVGRAGQAPAWAHSFDIGCRRVTEKFIRTDPPAPAELEAAREWVAQQLAEHLGEAGKAGVAPERLVAVAGTATTVVAVRDQMRVYDSAKVHKAHVTRPQLDRQYSQLAAMPLERRSQVVGLDPGRAPVIVAGLVIMQAVMDAVGVDGFTVSETDILHGIILDAAKLG